MPASVGITKYVPAILQSQSILKLPYDIWYEIGSILRSESARLSDLTNFMLSCKDANFIGNSILYRSVLLAKRTHFGSFAATAHVIIRLKSAFVLNIKVPDFFTSVPTAEDREVGRALLTSLKNLKGLEISRAGLPPSYVLYRRQLIHGLPLKDANTPASYYYWTPPMLTDLPFRLRRFVGAFSNCASTKVLFAAQPSILEWVATELRIPTPQVLDGREPTQLETVPFTARTSAGPDGKPHEFCTLQMTPTLLIRLKRVVICGRTSGTGTIDYLASFIALQSLSIQMPFQSTGNVTQIVTDILLLIIQCAPRLVDLRFVAFDATPSYQQPSALFRDLLQILELPGLRSLAISISPGEPIANLCVCGAQRILNRCPQLMVLDVRPIKSGAHAYRRSTNGKAYPTQRILSSYQGEWF